MSWPHGKLAVADGTLLQQDRVSRSPVVYHIPMYILSAAKSLSASIP